MVGYGSHSLHLLCHESGIRLRPESADVAEVQRFLCALSTGHQQRMLAIVVGNRTGKELELGL